MNEPAIRRCMLTSKGMRHLAAEPARAESVRVRRSLAIEPNPRHPGGDTKSARGTPDGAGDVTGRVWAWRWQDAATAIRAAS
jgi:hypothetical protein